MTDEQIEKGLECCGHRTIQDGGENEWVEDWCADCPYLQVDEETHETFCPSLHLIWDSEDYIKRLKDRIAELEKEKAVSDRALELLRRAEPTRVNSIIEQAKQELEKESK